MLKNHKGQSLIEYLVLVSLIAVGSISVVKVVGANVFVQMANVAQALGGKESRKREAHTVTDNQTKKKDFSDFFEDSVNSQSRGK